MVLDGATVLIDVDTVRVRPAHEPMFTECWFVTPDERAKAEKATSMEELYSALLTATKSEVM